MKKIIAVILVVAVLLFGVWRLFFTRPSFAANINDIMKNLNSYHMEANMSIKNGEDTRQFYVQVCYKKDDTNENFRVSFLDKTINQEQIIIRNNHGVFVLTPVLNQIYQLKGNWPLNSPKTYLFHSLIDVFNQKHEIKKISTPNSEDTYLVTSKADYKNSPNWVKQEISFSKDGKPLYVQIYNDNNVVVLNLTFTKVEFNPNFSSNHFSVEDNMKNARDQLESKIGAVEDDLPLMPVGADIDSTFEGEMVIDIGGEKVHVLKFLGNDDFKVIQKIISEGEETKVIEMSGELVELISGIGIMTTSNNNISTLTYSYNGVEYQIMSSTLTTSKIINIANGMEVVTKKE